MNDARKRIAGNINITNTLCWEWTGSPRDNGYCRTTYKRTSWYVHRLSYSSFIGAIPNGYDVCHKCDNRRCCNPAHLFVGTRRDNMQDAVKKNRVAKGEIISRNIRGEKCHLSKLTDLEVLEIRRMNIDGKKTSSISKKFNITTDNIRRIIRRDTWRHI